MIDFEKMEENAKTENERIFWHELGQFCFEGTDVEIAAVSNPRGMKRVVLNGYQFMIFFNNDSEDTMKAIAYATAAASRIISDYKSKLDVIKMMVE